MPWPFPHGRTAHVTRFTVNDRTQQRTVDTEASFDMASCAYDPGAPRRSGNQPVDAATQSPRVYGPYDADVRPGDQVTIDGVVGEYEVDGELLRHRNDLTGTLACSEIRLRRREGAL